MNACKDKEKTNQKEEIAKDFVQLSCSIKRQGIPITFSHYESKNSRERNYYDTTCENKPENIMEVALNCISFKFEC